MNSACFIHCHQIRIAPDRDAAFLRKDPIETCRLDDESVTPGAGVEKSITVVTAPVTAFWEPVEKSSLDRQRKIHLRIDKR